MNVKCIATHVYWINIMNAPQFFPTVIQYIVQIVLMLFKD